MRYIDVYPIEADVIELECRKRMESTEYQYIETSAHSGTEQLNSRKCGAVEK